jgi:hypothetical protein
MRLVCTRNRERGTFGFAKTRDDGFLLARVLASPLSLDSHFAAVAKAMKVPVALIHRIHSSMGEQDEYTCDPEAPEPPARRTVPPVSYRNRAIGGTEATVHGTFAGALSGPGDVIEWDGRAATCALDLDFHGVAPPREHDLLMFAAGASPQPALYWITRSGGLRMIYHACESFDAEELAACAAVPLLSTFSDGKVELKSRTRKPPGKVYQCVQTTTIPGRSSSSAPSQTSFTTWLQEHGYTIGQRYPHSRCPKNPSERATANSDPVVVYDDHIHCYICEADGRGGRWVPDDREETLFRACVDNLTHWGHARFIVEPMMKNPVLAKTVYRAALRVKYGDDPRIPSVFAAGEPNGLLRFDGHWGTAEGEIVSLGRDSSILHQLPAVQDTDGAPIRARVEWMSQGIDLSKMGYPALVVVWGCQVTRLQSPPANKVFTLLNSAPLRPDNMSARRPLYLAPGARMRDEEAWAVIERAFPCCNRAAVELLIAAKGCAEHRAGLPPMLFFTGPTGAGEDGFRVPRRGHLRR